MAEKRFKGEGKFVWHDLLTTDPEKVIQYYGNLFGWTFETIDMGPVASYSLISAQGVQIGGITLLGKEDGENPYWRPCVSVDDLERAVSIVPTVGGKVIVPDAGRPGICRYAVVEDPPGARISLFSGGDPDEEEYEGAPRPGTFIWNEVLSKDPEKSGQFYGGLFGWEFYSMELEDKSTYYLFRRGEENEGGMIAKPAEAEGPSAWLPYLAVDDLEAVLLKVIKEGGAIHVPPSDLAGIGRVAVTGDPTGALVALFHPQVPDEAGKE